jgi:hypothetical protein
MRSPLIILFLAAAVAVTGSSLRELHAVLLEKQYRSLEPELQSATSGIALAQRLARAAEPSARGWIVLSDAQRKAALALKGEARLEGLCEALGSLGHVLRLRPRGARYLVNWANLRQLLGTYKCKHLYTNGSFRKAVELALQSDPTQPAINYASGLILSWAGDHAQASTSFRQFLAFAVAPNQNQLDFITRYLVRRLIVQETLDAQAFVSGSPPAAATSPVLAIIPARFPQVLGLSTQLLERYPLVMERHVAALVELLEIALKRNQQERAALALGSELHRRNIERTLELIEALPAEYRWQRVGELRQQKTRGDLRRVLDVIAAQTLQQEPGAQRDSLSKQYFARRSQSRELRVARGMLAADTRPAKGQLSTWGTGQRVALDNFHQSVGFRLATQQSLDWIEISVPARSNAKALLDSLSVWISADNETWRPAVLRNSPQVARFGSLQWIVLEPEVREAAFWKVNFRGAERTQELMLPLGTMLRAFGHSLFVD